MKKIYIKPSLLVEKFTTEEVLATTHGKTNVLSAVTTDSGFDSYSGKIHFDAPGSDNVLNSIDYSTFTN